MLPKCGIQLPGLNSARNSLRPPADDLIAAQQRIENALSAALRIMRRDYTTDDLTKAAARASSAAMFIDQLLAARSNP